MTSLKFLWNYLTSNFPVTNTPHSANRSKQTDPPTPTHQHYTPTDLKRMYPPENSTPTLLPMLSKSDVVWILFHTIAMSLAWRLTTKKPEQSYFDKQSPTPNHSWRSSSSLSLPTADSPRLLPKGYLLGLASEMTKTHFEELW